MVGNQAATTDSSQSTVVRIYGVELAESPSPLRSVLYYGFRAGINEVRVPTARIFHLRPEDVLESGDASGFDSPAVIVRYFDLPLGADVVESRAASLERPRKVNLAAEVIRATGGTFASLVAQTPTPRMVDISELETLPREEILARIKGVMSARESFGGRRPDDGGVDGGESALSAYCSTYRQSYYWTFFQLDPWGADCD